jgi:hypothetical protein
MVVLVFHGRVKHDDAPVSAEVPLSQERQEEAPVLFEKVPASHCVRARRSDAGAV